MYSEEMESFNYIGIYKNVLNSLKESKQWRNKKIWAPRKNKKC